jgi:hypothetical protein
MSDLVDVLSTAFAEESRRSAERDLADNITATAYWSFAPSPGAPE